MLSLDLTGKRALVAGVADDNGFGFAIAKSLAEAGASVCVATWPPALNIFRNLIERGKIDDSRRMPDGSLLDFERIYPLDAAYDTLDDAPEDVRSNKRYKELGDFSIQGLVGRLTEDFGEQPLDILVHSLANGPEVRKDLLDTSRSGYLAAISVSAYSLISMISRFGPLFRAGGSIQSLSYMASERVIYGYGGGMSSAKAALESDTRTLGVRGGAQVGRTRQHHLGRPLRVACRQRGGDRGEAGRVLRGQRADPRGAHRRRSGARRRPSSPRRSPAESPAPRSTSTRATTRWGWPSTSPNG